MIPITNFENYVVARDGSVTNTNTGRVLKPNLNENGYLYVSFWKNNRNNPHSVHRLVALAYIPNPDNKPFVNHIDANRSNPHVDNLEWCTQSENIQHAYRLGNMSQKQNFTVEELDWLLAEFLARKSMTELAKTMNVGLSRLTLNLRKRSRQTGKEANFDIELIDQKRIRNTEANANKQTPIVQMDMTGQELARYPSMTAATRALGKTTCGPISNALNPMNKQKIGYGYLWKFA